MKFYYFLLVSFVLAGCQTTQIDPEEVKTTLQLAEIGLPKNLFPQSRYGASWDDIVDGETKPNSNEKIPAIIFAHGCSGFESGQILLNLSQSMGIAFFAPDSFARPSRFGKGSCCGGICNPYQYRIEEVKHAFTEVKKLPWIDTTKLILAGHSEGGETVTRFSGTELGAAGIIISGANCRSGSGSWRGVASRVPTLLLYGRDDKLERWTGDCHVPSTTPRSKMLLLDGVGHQTFHSETAQQEIVEFLKSVLKD